MQPDLHASARAWLTAARDPAIADELDALYTLASDAITARGPACWASGRCCNFAAAGHRLYVTGLEAALTFTRLPEPLTLSAIDTAESRGGCPFQLANLCSIHTLKPLACRVYFCDRSVQDWQHELSERLLLLLRALHDRHSIPYHYGEWRSLLRAIVTCP